jgi:PAS domain S-box-containing protein
MSSSSDFGRMGELSPVGIFRTDPAGACLSVNRRWSEIAGLTEEEALGRGWLRAIHPEDRERVGLEWYASAEEGREFGLEYRFATASGRTTWVLGQSLAERGDAGEILGYVGTITDIGERKRRDEDSARARARLEEFLERRSEELAARELCFKRVVENTEAGYFRIGADGIYQDVNAAWLRMHGFSGPEEILGRHFSLTQVETDLDGATKNVEDLLSGIAIPPGEFSRRRQDGSVAYHSFSASPVFDGRRIVGIEGFIIDRTEEKRKDAALRESESRFKGLFENSPIGIFEEDFSLVAAGLRELRSSGVDDFRAHFAAHPEEVLRLASLVRVLDVNRTSLLIFGIDEEESLKGNLARFFGSESLPVFAEELAVLEEGGTRFESEIPVLDIAGRDRRFRIVLSVIPGGEPLSRVLVAFSDITDRVEAERRYEKLFEEMIDGFAIHEMIYDASGKPVDYRFLAVNPAFERLTGLAAVDIVGKTVLEILPDTERKWIEAYARVVETGKPAHFEDFATSLDRYYEVRAYRTAPGKFATGFDDITERKHSEEERDATIGLLRLVGECESEGELVREATAFFQRLAGCATAGIRLKKGSDYPYFETRNFPPEFVEAENFLCLRDPSGRPILNDTGNPIFDCLCGAIISRRFDPAKPFFTPHGSFWSNCTTEFLGGTTEADRGTRTRNRCNGEGYESVALLPLLAGESPIGLLQLNDKRRDLFSARRIAIWERLADQLAVAISKLRAEESLRSNEEKLDLALRSAGLGVWSIDLRENRRDYDSQTCGLLGLDPEKFAGTEEEFLAIVHPLDRDRIKAALGRCIGEGTAYAPEYRVIGPRGETRFIRARAERTLDGKGLPTAITGVLWDATEELRLREALADSEALYRSLFESMLNGIAYCEMIYEKGLPVDFRYIHVNLAFERLTGFVDAAGKLVSALIPGIRESDKGLFEIYGRVATSGRPERFEYYLEALRQWFWLSIFSPRRGYFVAVFDVITERKKAEESIRLSEQRFKELFENMSSCVAILGEIEGGAGYLVKDVNHALERVERLDRADLVGRSLQRSFPGLGDTGLLEALVRAGRTGVPERVGPRFYIDARIRGWRDYFVFKLPSSELVLLYDEVTERMEAEEALRESEERFRLAIENAALPMMIHADDGKVEAVNKSWTELSGYGIEDLPTIAEWTRLAFGNRAEEVRKGYETFYGPAQKRNEGLEVITAKGGETRIWDFSSSPIGRFRDGRRAVISTAVDMTERIAAEEGEKERRKQLIQTEKLASLGILVAGVAHEINNPNHTIMLNSSLVAEVWSSLAPVLDRELDEDSLLGGMEYRELRTAMPGLLKGMKDASTDIDGIVRGLKGFASVDESAPFEELDLNLVVQAAASLLATFIKKATARFRLDLGSDLPPVRGSFQRLEQVLVNLIQNSCQSLAGKDKAVVISTAYDAERDRVLLVVRDEGRGMSPEELAHVKDPFFTTKRSQGGTGLGVPISNSIIEEHGGTLAFRSAPGVGTQAIIELPFPGEQEKETQR